PPTTSDPSCVLPPSVLSVSSPSMLHPAGDKAVWLCSVTSCLALVPPAAKATAPPNSLPATPRVMDSPSPAVNDASPPTTNAPLCVIPPTVLALRSPSKVLPPSDKAELL